MKDINTMSLEELIQYSKEISLEMEKPGLRKEEFDKLYDISYAIGGVMNEKYEYVAIGQ